MYSTRKIKLTLPEILPLVLLLVNLLLDEVLVLRVVGVEDHDRLPPAVALLGVVHLEGGRDDEDGEGEALGVDAGLDELVGGAHGGAADEGEGEAHAGDPAGEDDGVAVVSAPGEEALAGRLVAAHHLLGELRLVLVARHGVLGAQVGGAPAVGVDDGAEGARRGDEEGAEGEGEAAEGGVAARGQDHAAHADGEAKGSADHAALEDLAEVRLFFFGGEDLHLGGGGGGGEVGWTSSLRIG